jgi:hypothetical protein
VPEDRAVPADHHHDGARFLDRLLLLQSHEGSRRRALQRIDAVSFPTWRDFAACLRAVSENIRRDDKKAAALSLAVVVRRRVSACRDIAGLVG